MKLNETLNGLIKRERYQGPAQRYVQEEGRRAVTGKPRREAIEKPMDWLLEFRLRHEQ